MDLRKISPLTTKTCGQEEKNKTRQKLLIKIGALEKCSKNISNRNKKKRNFVFVEKLSY